MDFAETLQLLMQENGISSYQLAKDLGVTITAITKWQNGSQPRPSSYKKLADYFGLTVQQLKDGAVTAQKTPPAKAEGESKEALMQLVDSLSEEEALRAAQMLQAAFPKLFEDR